MDNISIYLWVITILLLIIIFNMMSRKKRTSYNSYGNKNGLLFMLATTLLKPVIESFAQNLRGKSNNPNEYHYHRREYFMTKTEHEFFDILDLSFGQYYYIFPQVHLSTIFSEKIVSQNWTGARNHIDKKSVDFVFCDKQNISPLLAIELDDITHEREDRISRDEEVERIFKEANVPLLRYDCRGSLDRGLIVTMVVDALPPTTEHMNFYQNPPNRSDIQM